VVVPPLASRSGLGADEFGAAACPERTVSGQALADIRGTHPKVVGGVDDESTRVARLVYEQVTDNDVVTAPNATTAEAVKVFEGVYRDVNIALANELARLAPEVHLDVRTAIDLANTQPFCDIHDPGPGVGGHCIPVYPYFLAGTVDETTPVMTASREVNDAMPAHTAEMTGAVLAAHGVSLPDATVLLLGVTYKADVAELRNAPALHLARMLDDRGVTVRAADPLVDEWGELAGVEPVSAEAASDLEVDAVVLVTPHAEFREYDYEAFDAPILDGRDAVDAAAVDAPVYPLGGRWP
jgi:UDP-N-acetyl-D-mannosaminuronic acid dehydrogenase